MAERETSQVEIKETENIEMTNKTEEQNVPVQENVEQPTHNENTEVVESTVHKKVKKPLVIMPRKKAQAVTDDAKQNKKFAWLAYILFFIPLLINKKSNFVRLHANEGLEINIVDVLGLVLLICGATIKTASLVGHAILILCAIIGVSLLILTTISKIYMIITCLKGLAHQTPWFSKYRLIKDINSEE